MEQEWSDTSSSPTGPLPQQQLTWLLNREDFDEHVVQDAVNLCCVIVTSTLCRHSGIRRVQYPKLPTVAKAGALSADDDDEDADKDDLEDEEEETNADDYDDEDGENVVRPSRFFSDVKAKIVESEQNLSQRRHVRFFHVCACNEEETNITSLIAKDPTFATYGRKPSAFEVKELHRTAYKQLIDLVQLLEVTSTPCMLFFLKGEPVRYSMMVEPAPANRVDVTGAKDRIAAVGSNYVKWRRLLRNATVVRNEVMKEYDEAVREQARQEKREQKKRERAERRRLRALEEQENEDDEEEEGGDY